MQRRSFLRASIASLTLPLVDRLRAQEPDKTEQPKAKLLPTPIDAVQLALADLNNLKATQVEKQFIRYVWVENRDIATVVNFAINAVASKSANPYLPVLTGMGQLLRLDLRYIAPQANDLKHLIDTWEKLVFIEPFFHATITVPWFTGRNGVKTNRKIISAPYLGDAGLSLQYETGSFVPVVKGDWLVCSMTTTLDQRGKYYDFANVGQNQTEYLKTRGIDEKFIASLNSDNRVAIVRSGITGAPRGVEMAQGSGVLLTNGSGVVGITFDPGRENVKANADPLRTLLGIDNADEKNYKAREIILEKRNGFHEFSLWNQNGQRQNAVPPDVATDDLQPAGHPRELQPGIGCIRCHGIHDGWQPLKNNVRDLIRGRTGRPGIAIYGQLSNKNLADTIGLIADKYSGELNLPLQSARDTYSTAVFRCTNGMTVPKVSRLTADVYEHYVLDLVTPIIAAREIGYEVPDEDTAIDLLNTVWPTLDIGEDPTGASLKTGIGVNRFQWELFYPDAMTMNLETIAKQKKVN